MKLKQAREEAGLTQEQLAYKAGLSVKTISDLETGERVNPSLKTINKIKSILPDWDSSTLI